MRKILAVIKLLLIVPLLVTIFSPLAACATKNASNVIKLSGAWDLYYLSQAINNQHALDSSFPEVEMNPSISSVNDLKKGNYDAILTGRDLSATESSGLIDYVIGYDATCIILDENSYLGGNVVHQIKNPGLQDLSTEDLKQIFGGNLLAQGSKWQWNGDYYVRDPGLDSISALWNSEIYAWIKQPVPVTNYFDLLLGKYDTQTVLYQALGLDEKKIAATWNNIYTSPKLNLEEEVLSFEYQPGAPYSEGSTNFVFKLGFASRRVMTVAPQHIPARVVSVDGINPITNIQSIYDGTYRFSRKIHLYIRQNSSAAILNFAHLLQSDGGQKLIQDAGYLPIPPGK
jgi:ABC-type phosphate transport system substrate-binding protein